MATKRLTLELSADQYEFLRREADAEGVSVSAFIRSLIDARRASPPRLREDYRDDAFYRRRGSFKGPRDLSVKHDKYLYGEAEWSS
jgi:CopG-like RHH_1 or ribbon-helix-helix domain, RHH_5